VTVLAFLVTCTSFVAIYGRVRSRVSANFTFNANQQHGFHSEREPTTYRHKQVWYPLSKCNLHSRTQRSG